MIGLLQTTNESPQIRVAELVTATLQHNPTKRKKPTETGEQ